MTRKIVLDFSRSARENAQAFFDESKKLKAKIAGAEAGIRDVQGKLVKLEKQSASQVIRGPAKIRPKEWFEKFRWCVTRNGLLVIGGKDAHSNEAVVKKHLEENDWYFHADVHGAPHCVLKQGKSRAQKEDLEDAASFAGVFSSVWKKGLFSVRVYKVSRDQVSKKAPAGESLGKGAFMIYGSRDWFDPSLRLGWGVQSTKEGFRILCGPLAAVRAHASHVMELIPGSKSKTEIAKAYAHSLALLPQSISIPLDELVSVLPAGEFSLKPISSLK